MKVKIADVVVVFMLGAIVLGPTTWGKPTISLDALYRMLHAGTITFADFMCALSGCHGGQIISGKNGNRDSFSNMFCRPCQQVKNTMPARVNICFIVQTSCNIDRKAIDGAKQVISQIMQSSMLDKMSKFTIIKYSKTAQEWPKGMLAYKKSHPEIIAKFLKPTESCDGCSALTYLAVQKCISIIEGSRDSHHMVDGIYTRIPKVIVTFTNGFSFDSVYNVEAARLDTELIGTSMNQKGIFGVAPLFVEPSHKVDTDTICLEYDRLNSLDNACRGEDGEVILPSLENTEELFGNTVEVCSRSCCYTDLVFVIDTSSDMRREQVDDVFDSIRRFINRPHFDSLTFEDDFVLSDHIGMDYGIIVSLITYNSNARVVINLKDQLTKDELQDKLNDAKKEYFQKKYRDTGTALEKAHSLLTTTGRTGATKAIVVFTNGKSWIKREQKGGSEGIIATIGKANGIKRSGVNIYVVGLSSDDTKENDAYEKEWRHIVSEGTYEGCSFLDAATPFKHDGEVLPFDSLTSVASFLCLELCTGRIEERCIQNK